MDEEKVTSNKTPSRASPNFTALSLCNTRTSIWQQLRTDINYWTILKKNVSMCKITEKNWFSYHFNVVLLMFSAANSFPLNSDPCLVLFPPCTGPDVSSFNDALTIGLVCEGWVTPSIHVTEPRSHRFIYFCLHHHQPAWSVYIRASSMNAWKLQQLLHQTNLKGFQLVGHSLLHGL